MEYYVRKIRSQFSLLKAGGTDMAELCTHRPLLVASPPQRKAGHRRDTNAGREGRRVLHISTAD